MALEVEALWWCYKSAPELPQINFFPVVRNAGTEEIKDAEGLLTTAVELWSIWFTHGNVAIITPARGHIDYMKQAVNLSLDPGEIRTLFQYGHTFDYRGLRDNVPVDLAYFAHHRSFSYGLELRSDGPKDRRDFHIDLLGWTVAQLRAGEDQFSCANIPGDIADSLTNEPSFTDVLAPPGLVMGIWHSLNSFGRQGAPKWDRLPPPTSQAGPYLKGVLGGDLGAPEGEGFSWWMVKDNPNGLPADWGGKLPPGLVFGLRHSINNSEDDDITVFGQSSVDGYSYIYGANFDKTVGGDEKAPKGEGFFWYESADLNFKDWKSAEEKLPRGTVLGLRHSENLKTPVGWAGNIYYPWKSAQAPPGFEHRDGGDRGLGPGQGFFWFEKTKGPKPPLPPVFSSIPTPGFPSQP